MIIPAIVLTVGLTMLLGKAIDGAGPRGAGR